MQNMIRNIGNITKINAVRRPNLHNHTVHTHNIHKTVQVFSSTSPLSTLLIVSITTTNLGRLKIKCTVINDVHIANNEITRLCTLPNKSFTLRSHEKLKRIKIKKIAQ